MADTKQPTADEKIAALEARLAKQADQIDALMVLVKAQAVQPDSEWTRERVKQAALEGVHAAIAAYIELPYQDRSQIEANRYEFDGKLIFSVLLGTGKKGEWPRLAIRADRPGDAKSRYMEVCGIGSVTADANHPEFSRWTVADATKDKAAQDAVNLEFEYEQAA